jgi:hypothetical protein
VSKYFSEIRADLSDEMVCPRLRRDEELPAGPVLNHRAVHRIDCPGQNEADGLHHRHHCSDVPGAIHRVALQIDCPAQNAAVDLHLHCGSAVSRLIHRVDLRTSLLIQNAAADLRHHCGSAVSRLIHRADPRTCFQNLFEEKSSRRPISGARPG